MFSTDVACRSTATLEDTSIQWCGQRCLCVQEKADVTLNGVTMSGADIGLWMRGARVKVRHCFSFSKKEHRTLGFGLSAVYLVVNTMQP